MTSLAASQLSLDDAQYAHAQAIVGEVRRRGLPERAAVVALETALVESTIRVFANSNVPESLTLPYDQGCVGSDHLSVGIFQQQTPMWGPCAECMDPATSAGKFLDRLVGVSDWQTKPTGEAAQSVQISAFPDRYQEQETWATQIAHALWTSEGEFTLDAEAKAAFAALSDKIDHDIGEAINGDKTHLNDIANVLRCEQSLYNVVKALAVEVSAIKAKVNA